MIKKTIKTRGILCADCGEAQAQYMVLYIEANLLGLDKVKFAQLCPDCQKGDVYNV